MFSAYAETMKFRGILKIFKPGNQKFFVGDSIFRPIKFNRKFLSPGQEQLIWWVNNYFVE